MYEIDGEWFEYIESDDYDDWAQGVAADEDWTK